MLCSAVIPVWPDGFYALLRLVVCCAAGYAAYRLNNNEKLSGHCIPLVGLAILFNPLVPIHMDRLFWLPIDFGDAVYPPTQKTSGRKPEDECVGRTLRSVSVGGFVKCFGGFRRRNIRNHGCKAVGLHFLTLSKKI